MAKFLKGSRFYTLSPFVLIAAFGLSWRFDDPSTFLTVATTWMALAGTKSAVGTLKGNGS